MAENYIGFKLPADMRAAIVHRATLEGITASEWIRAAILSALQEEAPMVDDGYRQARGLANQMASIALRRGLQSIPETFEEWVAMLEEEAARDGNY